METPERKARNLGRVLGEMKHNFDQTELFHIAAATCPDEWLDSHAKVSEFLGWIKEGYNTNGD